MGKFPHTLMKGGRLRKRACGIVSFAPLMATASMVTLGAMLFATSPAGAGDCPAPVSGESECTGAAGTDSTVTITVGAGEGLTLTDDSAFGLDVANGEGIAIRSASTTGAINLDLDGDIKAQQNTIDINQDGTGAVSVTTRGAITSTSGKGISAETVDSSGGVTINSNAGISAMDDGINVKHSGGGTVVITANNVAAGGHGIYAFAEEGSTAQTFSIVANGNIDASEDAIDLAHRGTGNIEITTAAGTTLTSDNSAIELHTGNGSGSVTITANGAIGTSSDMIEYQGIYAYHYGVGDLAITVNDIFSKAEGIEVTNYDKGSDSSFVSGDMTIIALGDINTSGSNSSAIRAVHQADGALVITTTAGKTINSAELMGISAKTTSNSSGVTINSNADILALMGDGIGIEHSGGGVVTINASNISAGNDGIHAIAAVGSTAETFTITANGNIDASGDAIDFDHLGTGNIEITTATSTILTADGTALASDGNGIDIYTSSNSGSVTITANGAIGTSSDRVENNGIYVYHQGAGDLAVTANDAIASSADGVKIRQFGVGAVTIIASNIASGDHGIYAIAETGSAAGIFTITANGDIDASEDAIDLAHLGTGNIEITTAVGTTLNSDNSGIELHTSNSSGSVTITANGAIGTSSDRIEHKGIYAYHYGTGDLVITVNDIFAKDDGIELEQRGRGSVTITVGDDGSITTDKAGIYINQAGIGAVTVITGARTDLISYSEHGVYIETAQGTTGDVEVSVGGTITAEQYGVYVSQHGTGTVTITTEGAVTSNAARGIEVQARSASTGDVTIIANGTITASSNIGIYLSHRGSGATSITSAAIISSGSGISLTTRDSTTSATITTNGTIDAGTNGVTIDHFGSDALSITTAAIDAGHRGIHTNITPNSNGGVIRANGAIIAEYEGIYAYNQSTGTLTVTVADGATVTSNTKEGVEITAGNDGNTAGDIEFKAYANITAAEQAIRIDQYGVGDAAITLGDGVELTSTKEEGITTETKAWNNGAVTITAGANGSISAEKDAISVHHYGTGGVAIATGAGTDLTSMTGHGAYVLAGARATGDVEVSVGGTITAEKYGVYVSQHGTGTVTITTEGAVTSNAARGIEVQARSASTGDVTIIANGTVTASSNIGIYVSHRGSGATSITSAAIISSGSGISLTTRDSTTSATITANGTIGAGTNGVTIDHFGKDALSITTATIDAGNRGIHANIIPSSNGGVIRANGVIIAEYEGIYAYNQSTGTLTVTVADGATVTSNTKEGVEITAGNDGNTAGDIEFKAYANITAAEQAIRIDQYGVGTAAITLGDGVELISTKEEGITTETKAWNNGAVTITAGANGSISAEKDAVSVRHYGTGAVTSATGAGTSLTSMTGHGVYVLAGARVTGDVEVSVGGVITAEKYGVYVSRYGTGAVTITTEGAVTSNTARGIEVQTKSASTSDVTVIANGTVTASSNIGIYVSHRGSGSTDITSAAITSSGSGISLTTRDSTTSATITTNGTIDAGANGVSIDHFGSDALSITTAAIDAGNRGIQTNIIQSSSGGVIRANGAITAEYEGIYAYNQGTGTLAVTVADGATVTSNTKEGVEIVAGNDGNTAGDIEFKAYANITAAEQAIRIDQYGVGTAAITLGDGVELISTKEEGITTETKAWNNGAVTITAGASGSISAEKDAIFVRHYGTGAVAVTTGAGTDLTSTAGHGVRILALLASAQTTGGVDVSIGGNIAAEKTGIDINQAGAGAVTVTTNAGTDLMSDNEHGVHIETSQGTTGDVEVSVGGTVTGTTGLYINNIGSGNTTISVGGAVTGMAGSAISLQGRGTQTVIMNDGASLNGNLQASLNTGTAILQFAAEFVDFDFSGVSGIDSVVVSDSGTLGFSEAGSILSAAVTLSGRLAFIGASSVATFDAITASGGDIDVDVDFSGGSVTLITARLTATSVDGTIPVNIRAIGGNAPNQQVTISNLIALSDSDAFTEGKPLNEGFTFNLVYDTTNTRWNLVAAPSTTDGGSEDGSGNDGDNGDDGGGSGGNDGSGGGSNGGDGNGGNGNGGSGGDGGGSGGNDGSGGGSNGGDGNGGNGNGGGGDGGGSGGGDSSGGGSNDGDGNGGSGDGNNGGDGGGSGGDNGNSSGGDGGDENRGSGDGGNDGNGDGNRNSNNIEKNIEAALFESLPSILSRLASLESYQQRIQGRVFANGDCRIYGKLSTTSSEIESSSTNMATYDLDNTNIQFGFDVPLRISRSYIADAVKVGGHIAFGKATTDVSIASASGEISTDSFKVAINATWENDDGIYADGQIQYATFGNDIETDTKIVSTDAAAYSLGVEIGWGMELEGFSVMPSAQIAWTSVDFEDFTDSAGTAVALGDGNVLGGRIGVAVEQRWNGIMPEDLLLRGHVDLLTPLEGWVAVDVGGAKMSSEHKDPSIAFGIGASYAWDRFGISANVSTQQGEGAKGYAGSIGMKYSF